MGAIFYGSKPRIAGAKKDAVVKSDATKRYLEHYGKYLVLGRLGVRSPDPSVRAQAAAELEVCERKMRHWESRPDYDQNAALRGIGVLKRQMRQMAG